MNTNFAAALSHVLTHEGGWADHPRDPGGATMRGVTLYTFRFYYGERKTKSDLRHITERQLAHIYRKGYWDACRCDDLPSGIDTAVFDTAVNSGPVRAAKWLQRTVSARADGIIGPKTLAKVADCEPAEVIDRLLDRRLGFLLRLRIWLTFGRGWSRRVEGVRLAAMALADEAQQRNCQ